MRIPSRLVSLFAVVLLLGACGDSGVTTDLQNVTVDTAVDRTFINAGAMVKVSCIVTDPDGREVKTDTAFTVEPGKGVVVDGAEVTPSNPGEYVVTCMLPDGSLPDETPETVVVTRKNIASVETTLSANTVMAGASVDVTCTVLNSSGDEVAWDTEVLVTPEGGVEVDGHTLKTLTMGQFEVACAAVELPIVDDSPEALDVVAGEPVLVRATIKEDEVEAGTEVPVFCTVEDENGNALEFESVVDPQEGLEVTGPSIIPHVAGEYDVFCSAPELPELEQVSDHLVVTPGPIASIVLTAKPSKSAYKVGDKVEVIAHAADIDGNPVEGEFDYTITAPEGVKESGEKYEFLEEGLYTFIGTLAPPYDDISGELTLVCDENGPEIVLFVPERAATLDGSVMVDVEGNVMDLFSSTVDLEINGKGVPVDDDGNFFHVVEAAHGMNILTVKAADEYGNKSKHVQSFYYSTEYLDYESNNVDEVLLEQSLILFLGQNFLDDGVHDVQSIDDIATLVEILLDGIDFNALVPPDQAVLDTVMEDLVNVPLLNQMGFELSLHGDLGIKLYIEQVSFATPFVAIDTREGGIDMNISFSGPAEDPGIFVELIVQLNFALEVQSTFGGNDLLAVGINPGIAVESSVGIESLLVETSFDVHKEVGQDLDITVVDLNVVPAGFDIQLLKDDTKLILGPININGQGIIDLGEVELGQLGFMQQINTFLSDSVIDPVLDFVVPAVLDLVEPLLEDQVTNLLGNLLNQFELALPIPIPQLPGATQGVDVTFKTRLSSVVFTDDGGELGLAAGFMAPKGVDRTVLGSLLRAGCGGNADGWPTFDALEKFMFAAAEDMVNELFFSIWWGGALHLVLDETVLGNVDLGQFGISDLAVDAEFLLPPILDDCTAKGMVELQIGDLLLTPSFSIMGAPMTVAMYVSASLDAVVYGDGSEIGLQINGITDIGTHIVSVEGNLTSLFGLDIEQLVEDVLVPMIVDQVSNLSLGSFPIPEIDLSSLLPGIPPGTSLSLDNLVIEMQKGYLVFGGELK